MGKLAMTAGILAGGESRRMGRDKTQLSRGDTTFLAHLIGELSDFDEVLVSVRSSEQSQTVPCATVIDELRGTGPIEGIYQLLRRARNDFTFVLAADMQNIDAAFAQRFAAALQPKDRCLVTCIGEKLEPLCAIYHKDALPHLKRLRQDGVRRPRALFPLIPTRYIDLSALGCGEDLTENINTPQDYERWLQKKK